MKLFVASGIVAACLLSPVSAKPEYQTGQQSRIRLNLGLMVPPIQVKLPRMELPQLIIGANIVRRPNARPLTISMPPLPQISFGGNSGGGGGGGEQGGYGGGSGGGGGGGMDQYSAGSQIKTEKMKLDETPAPAQQQATKVPKPVDAQAPEHRPHQEPSNNFRPPQQHFQAPQQHFQPPQQPFQPHHESSYLPIPQNIFADHPAPFALPMNQQMDHSNSFMPQHQMGRPDAQFRPNHHQNNHHHGEPNFNEMMSFLVPPPNAGYDVMPNFSKSPKMIKQHPTDNQRDQMILPPFLPPPQHYMSAAPHRQSPQHAAPMQSNQEVFFFPNPQSFENAFPHQEGNRNMMSMRRASEAQTSKSKTEDAQ